MNLVKLCSIGKLSNRTLDKPTLPIQNGNTSELYYHTSLVYFDGAKLHYESLVFTTEKQSACLGFFIVILLLVALCLNKAIDLQFVCIPTLNDWHAFLLVTLLECWQCWHCYWAG